MDIQVLGSGCPTCKKLYELTSQTVEELGIDVKVSYITGAEGMDAMLALGAMGSPVLAINGKIALVGSTSSKDEIRRIIENGAITPPKTGGCTCGGNC
ncbi:MAG TPA: thioredoxin family protein [Candidatus Woesebacteria bacterium]|nr:thioredoxin family protein [Candidatus Woesebacteria bacterium]HNS94814.1 thioredoxin family protein [Candidatus Woesebacteria bacterium]